MSLDLEKSIVPILEDINTSWWDQNFSLPAVSSVDPNQKIIVKNEGTWTVTVTWDSWEQIDWVASLQLLKDEETLCVMPNAWWTGRDVVSKSNYVSVVTDLSLSWNDTWPFCEEELRWENDTWSLNTPTNGIAQKVFRDVEINWLKKTETTIVENYEQNTLYVDIKFWDDSIGRRERYDLPYKTVAAAVADSSPNDMISMREGSYPQAFISTPHDLHVKTDPGVVSAIFWTIDWHEFSFIWDATIDVNENVWPAAFRFENWAKWDIKIKSALTGRQVVYNIASFVKLQVWDALDAIREVVRTEQAWETHFEFDRIVSANWGWAAAVTLTWWVLYATWDFVQTEWWNQFYAQDQNTKQYIEVKKSIKTNSASLIANFHYRNWASWAVTYQYGENNSYPIVNIDSQSVWAWWWVVHVQAWRTISTAPSNIDNQIWNCFAADNGSTMYLHSQYSESVNDICLYVEEQYAWQETNLHVLSWHFKSALQSVHMWSWIATALAKLKVYSWTVFESWNDSFVFDRWNGWITDRLIFAYDKVNTNSTDMLIGWTGINWWATLECWNYDDTAVF